MTFFGPPRAPVSGGRAADWRAFFANSRLVCSAWFSTERYGVNPWGEGAPPAPDVPVASGSPLLDALDSDETFAVAHWMFTEGIDRIPFAPHWGLCDPAPHGADSMTYNGLVIRCQWTPTRMMPEGITIDPAQRPAIRDYWHRRLRVPARSFGYGWLVAAIRTWHGGRSHRRYHSPAATLSERAGQPVVGAAPTNAWGPL